MKVQGCVALVTGANRGLGRAYVEALQAAGASRVYAAARDPDSVHLPGAIPIRLDVTDAAQVAAAAAARGDVDLLINNAGISLHTPWLADAALDTARKLFETNVFGMLAMSQAFAPVLKANGGGALVNMLSVLSWLSMPMSGGYCASKSAAWALTNGLRDELRGQGTQVLAVHAGLIDTDMARHIDSAKISPGEVALRTIEALEAGLDEVLADETSRQVKRGFVAEPPVYTRPWGA